MNPRILLVDDEPNVLRGLRRQLRGRFDVQIAEGGRQALELLDGTSYDVIVSDMRMPEINGAELLARARGIAPDTVRMILSGQAEMEATIRAVNEGHIFRFLTKPCETDDLLSALDAAVEQRRLILAEKELLEKTLFDAVKTLTELLSLVHPTAFSRSSRLHAYVGQVLEAVPTEGAWQVELAALLSQIGLVSVPGETLARHEAGQPLGEREAAMIAKAGSVAERLVGKIPRLEHVASMLAAAPPAEPEPIVTIGRALLGAAIEFDRRTADGSGAEKAAAEIAAVAELPDPMRSVIARWELVSNELRVRTVTVAELCVGMVCDEPLHARTGALLVPTGQTVSFAILERVRNFAEGVGVVEPFRVRVPT